MKCITYMGKVFDYIEDNITGIIDYEEIGKITACNPPLFQRIFAYITGVSLAEYIRRRKLTLAAIDIQLNRRKVIDVSYKYGYQSPDAFSVAFSRMHGMTPLEAKKSQESLKFYPRMSFDFKIKGDTYIDYHIRKKPQIDIVGKSTNVRHSDGVAPPFWDECERDGTIKKLRKLSPRAPMVGIFTGNTRHEMHKYMIGVEVKKDMTPTDIENAGFNEIISVPATVWAIVKVNGPIPSAMQNMFKRIYSELTEFGNLERAGQFELEVYFPGDRSEEDYYSEIWIPVEAV